MFVERITNEPPHGKTNILHKGADQLRGSREADQRLCFRYSDSTTPLLPNTKFQTSLTLCVLHSDLLQLPWVLNPRVRIQ